MAKSRDELSLKLFYVAYAMYVMSILFSTVDFILPILHYIHIISFAMFLCVICLQIKKYTKKDIIIMLLVSLVFLLSFIHSMDNRLIKIPIILFAAKSIDFNSFIEKDVRLRFFIFITIILLSLYGVIPNKEVYRAGSTIRYSLGFIHPNHCSYHFMIIVFEYTYLKLKDINIKITFPFSLIMAFIINHFTGSRTSLCVLLLYLILYTITFYNKKVFNKKMFKIMSKYLLIIIIVVFSLILLLYTNNNQIGVHLNTIFSDRLKYIARFIEAYGISLFGQKITYITVDESAKLLTGTMILDNSYFRILLNYGVVMFITYVYANVKLIEYLWEKYERNVVLLLIMCMLLLFGVMEYRIIEIESNPFMILFSLLIFRSQKKGRSKVK